MAALLDSPFGFLIKIAAILAAVALALLALGWVCNWSNAEPYSSACLIAGIVLLAIPGLRYYGATSAFMSNPKEYIPFKPLTNGDRFLNSTRQYMSETLSQLSINTILMICGALLVLASFLLTKLIP